MMLITVVLLGAVFGVRNVVLVDDVLHKLRWEKQDQKKRRDVQSGTNEPMQAIHQIAT